MEDKIYLKWSYRAEQSDIKSDGYMTIKIPNKKSGVNWFLMKLNNILKYGYTSKFWSKHLQNTAVKIKGEWVPIDRKKAIKYLQNKINEAKSITE